MSKTILLLRDVTVYRVKPPYPVKGSRFKSTVWSNRDKLWSVTLRLCLGKGFREVRLEEPGSGALFSSAFIPSHTSDYSVLNSNEYFVLKFTDGDQNRMHLGLSFSESSDALKFYRALLCQDDEEEVIDVDDSSEEVHVDVNDSGKMGKDLAFLSGVAGDAGEDEDDVGEDEEDEDDVSEDEEEDDDLGEGTSGPRTEEDEMNDDASFEEVHIDVDNSASLRKMGTNMPYGNVSEARKFIDDHYDKIEAENVRLHDELAKLKTVNSRNLELLNEKDEQLKTFEMVNSRNLQLLNTKDDQLKTLEGEKSELQRQKSVLLKEMDVYNNRIEELEKNQRNLYRLLIAISRAIVILQGEQENYIQSTLNSVQEQGNNIRSNFENLINNINGRIANSEAEMSAS